MIPRKHRRRAKRLQKLLGRTIGDYLLRMTPATQELIDEKLKKGAGPMLLASIIPLGYLYVNPTLTKAYVCVVDPVRHKPVFQKLRWLRWFLFRPRTLKMAPGG